VEVKLGPELQCWQLQQRPRTGGTMF